MSRVIRLRRDAQAEYDAAADWYDLQRAGLGAEFVGEVDAALREIADRPLQFAEVWGEVRETQLARFPYCVYFRIRGESIIVVAVCHTSRDPATWQSRL